MADIRIKDLATTASSTAADDFLAVDGTTNGTRKLSAATPSFATSVTVPGVAGPTATDLTLAGGSTGASLVLGQGTTANAVLTSTGATGQIRLTTASNGTNALSSSVVRIASNISGGDTTINFTDSVTYNGYLGMQGGNLNFGANTTTPQMRLATTGNLLIGTTTDGGQKLQVNGTASFAGAVSVGGNATVTGGQVIGPAGTTGLQAYPSSLTGFGALYGDANATTGVVFYGSSHATKANKVEITAPAGTTLVGTGNNLTVSGTGTSTFAGAVTASNATANTPTLSLAATATSTGISFLNTIPSAPAGERNWAILTNSAAYGDLVLKQSNAQGGNPITAGTAALSFDVNRAATFAGAVTGSRFIASTSLIAGDFTSTNDLGIVAKTTTANYNPLIAAFLAPNQLTFGVGASSSVYCGVAQSAYNSGALMFSYAGAGSTSNSFGLGIYGQSPAIRIDGTGVVNIPSTTPSTGAGSGALQVAGGIYSGAASVFGSSIGIGGAPYFSAKLTVDGNVIVAGGLGVAGARGGPITNIYNDGGTTSTSKAFQIGNSSGTTLATFEYGGNVGIGTTTPATKLDVNGAATFAGTVIAPAATTAISSVRLPHGTAPTSPVNGDMWTTTAGLYVRINGVTVGPLS